MKQVNPKQAEKCIQNLQDLQEHVLPHLQQFCSLEERAPVQQAAVEEKSQPADRHQPTEMKYEAENSQKTEKHKPTEIKSKEVETKKSIHERLKENKERLLKSGRQNVPQKGVELA